MSSVRLSYNINVHNIGLLHVFIGILIIKEDEDPSGKEMGLSTIALITIVPNIMSSRAFVRMETNVHIYIELRVIQKGDTTSDITRLVCVFMIRTLGDCALRMGPIVPLLMDNQTLDHLFLI